MGNLFISADRYQTVNGYGNSTLTSGQDYLLRINDPQSLQGSGLQIGFLDINHNGSVDPNENIMLFSQSRLANGNVVYLTFGVTPDGKLQLTGVLDKNGNAVPLSPDMLNGLKSSTHTTDQMTSFIADCISRINGTGAAASNLKLPGGKNPLASGPPPFQMSGFSTDTPWSAWGGTAPNGMNVFGKSIGAWYDGRMTLDWRDGHCYIKWTKTILNTTQQFGGEVVSANDGTRDLLFTRPDGSQVRLIYRPPVDANDTDPTHGSFYMEDAEKGCLEGLSLDGLSVNGYGSLKPAYMSNSLYMAGGEFFFVRPDGTLSARNNQEFVFDPATRSFIPKSMATTVTSDQQALEQYGSDFTPTAPLGSATSTPTQQQTQDAAALSALLLQLAALNRPPNKTETKQLLAAIAKVHPTDFVKIFLDPSNPNSTANLNLFNTVFSKASGSALIDGQAGLDAETINNLKTIEGIVGGAFYSVAYGLAGSNLPKLADGSVAWASVNGGSVPSALNASLTQLQSLGQMQNQMNLFFDAVNLSMSDRVALVQYWSAGVQNLTQADLTTIVQSGQAATRLNPAKAFQSLGQLFLPGAGGGWARQDITQSSQQFLSDVFKASANMYASVALNLNNNMYGSASGIVTFFDRQNFAYSTLAGIASNAFSSVSTSASNWFTDQVRSSYESFRSAQDTITKIYDKQNEALQAAARN